MAALKADVDGCGEWRRVLVALADNLDDGAIRAAVTGVDPAGVRQVLRGLAGEAGGDAGPADGDGGAVAGTGGAAIMFTDGASRGNPGEAGAGAVFVGRDGEEIAARCWYLGRTTNNVAEYLAVIHGLSEALGLGIKDLDVRMDSELVVMQLNGRYKVKNPGLKDLFARVQRLRQRFDRITFSHVRREFNRRADRLANQAIDRRAG